MVEAGLVALGIVEASLPALTAIFLAGHAKEVVRRDQSIDGISQQQDVAARPRAVHYFLAEPKPLI
jgi:hypothetical protein